MANTPQAKRIRRNATRTVINHSQNQPHPVHQGHRDGACSRQKADAAEALKKMQPEIARGVSRGVIHKNTAARKISRLSKQVASLG